MQTTKTIQLVQQPLTIEPTKAHKVLCYE